MTAGTSTMRMTVASSRATKLVKTAIMMSAAVVLTRAEHEGHDQNRDRESDQLAGPPTGGGLRQVPQRASIRRRWG
jgi:hypothetical protein